MAINWGGVAGMIVFYLVILIIGLLASRKKKTANTDSNLVANHQFGWVVGVSTLTATWVGGGLLNGTAEVVFTPGFGLVWAQAPYLLALGCVLNGIIFAYKMRKANYVTMIDPFSDKYGTRMGGLIFLVCVMGETLYASAILTALGSSISVILNIDQVLSVVISSCIAAFYTLFGGIWSVAYTDIAQLGLVVGGLWLSFPFALTNPAVLPVTETKADWLGEWDNKLTWVWIDLALLLLLGGLPWQAYYQRALSARTPRLARDMSILAAVGVLICSIPPYLIGMIGASTDWSMTSIDLNQTDVFANPNLILPAVLQYLTPAPVAFFGLGAVSAAVMSSTDSTFLSLSSMFGRNIYRNMIRPHASEQELVWVMRAAVVVVAGISTMFALVVKSTYGLFLLGGDFVYVILVPQLFSVIHVPIANTYGAVVAYVMAIVLRLLAGEPTLGLPEVIRYPGFEVIDGVPTQLFPFRTFTMGVSLSLLLIVSFVADVVFRRGWLDAKWDLFRCFVDKDNKLRPSALEVGVYVANGTVEHEADVDKNDNTNL